MVLTAEHEIHGEESDPEIQLLPLYILRPHAPDHNQYQHFDESGPLFALISVSLHFDY